MVCFLIKLKDNSCVPTDHIVVQINVLKINLLNRNCTLFFVHFTNHVINNWMSPLGETTEKKEGKEELAADGAACLLLTSRKQTCSRVILTASLI